MSAVGFCGVEGGEEVWGERVEGRGSYGVLFALRWRGFSSWCDSYAIASLDLWERGVTRWGLFLRRGGTPFLVPV